MPTTREMGFWIRYLVSKHCKRVLIYLPDFMMALFLFRSAFSRPGMSVELIGVFLDFPMWRVEGLLLKRTQVLALPISRAVFPFVLSLSSIPISI